MDEALTIEVRHEQGCAIVTAAGEIGISTLTAACAAQAPFRCGS
jgi:hypothetical protein